MKDRIMNGRFSYLCIVTDYGQVVSVCISSVSEIVPLRPPGLDCILPEIKMIWLPQPIFLLLSM